MIEPSPSLVSVVCVTENPSDYPGQFVARVFMVEPHRDAFVMRPVDPPLGVADSLLEVRRFVPPGLVRFNPDPDDDPVIVEVWI